MTQKRRPFRRTVALLALTFVTLTASGDELAEFLSPTPGIDSEHPSIAALAQELTVGATTDAQKAQRIHDWVRDRVPFGFAGAFFRQMASEVLVAERGYSMTKGLLFVALLRAARVPARLHFVDILAEVLNGYGVPGEYLDHCFTEVRIDGKWLRTDSYVVDATLFRNAQARLGKESRALGYGVHGRGTDRWNATGDAFSQFLDDGSVSRLARRDHGVFADVKAFFEQGKPNFRPNFFERLLFRFVVRTVNRSVERVREG